MNALEKKVINFYDSKKKYPDYAVCEIRWCDTKETERVVIALFEHTENTPKEVDEQIFFYVSGLSGLLSLLANLDFTKEDFEDTKAFYNEVEKYHTEDPDSEDWTYLHRGEDFAIIDVIAFT